MNRGERVHVTSNQFNIGIPQRKVLYLGFLPANFIGFAKEQELVIISNIDGDEAVHNTLRPHRNPAVNSYQRTVRVLDKLRQAPLPFYLRTTVTSLNDDRLVEIADLHSQLGAKESIFGLLRPVNSDGIIFDLALLPDSQRLEASIRRLMHQRPQVLQNFINALLGRMGKPLDARACGAAYISTPTVDANGDVYACAWFVGQKHRKLGNVGNDAIVDQAAAAMTFQEFDPTAEPACAACDYFAVCKGGCAATRLVAASTADQAVRDRTRLQQCTMVITICDELLTIAGRKQTADMLANA